MSTQGKKPPSSSLLSSERAALSQTGLATGGLAQHGGATLADDDGLGVGEDGGDGEAAGALDVHEEGSGGRDESLEVIIVRWVVGWRKRVDVLSYLELVLLGLGGRGGVEEINGENLGDMELAKCLNRCRSCPNIAPKISSQQLSIPISIALVFPTPPSTVVEFSSNSHTCPSPFLRPSAIVRPSKGESERCVAYHLD